MRLNSPPLFVFLIALAFALLAVATKISLFGMPRFLPHQEFWMAILAYLTLMIGNLVRGI